MSNSAALALLLLLLGSPLGICIIHAVLTRVIRFLGHSIAPQLVVLGTVLLGNIPMVWMAWSLAIPEFAGNLYGMSWCVAYVVLTYNALGFCYFCVLNVSETSLHVHILMHLLLSGRMRRDELAARYDVSTMISARVERMIALGQLRSRGGFFVVNNRGLLTVGRILHIWRKLLKLPLSPV
jgi:hypothetical protein